MIDIADERVSLKRCRVNMRKKERNTPLNPLLIEGKILENPGLTT